MALAGEAGWAPEVPSRLWSLRPGQADDPFEARWRSRGLKDAAESDFSNGIAALVLASHHGHIVFDLKDQYPNVSEPDLIESRETAERALDFVIKALDDQLRSGAGYEKDQMRSEFGQQYPQLSDATFSSMFNYAGLVTR